jgi:cytochrome P450
MVPLEFPIRDPSTGVQTSKLLITKGTAVYIGLGAANRSAAIWGPDANELKPDRWIGKNIADGTENSVKMPGIFSNM